MAKKNMRAMLALAGEMKKNGSMSTHQCYFWWNDRYRYGVTMSRLGNYLAKSGVFEKVDRERVWSGTNWTYVDVWFAKEVKE